MEGAASLQNTIIMAVSMLKHIPDYGHKEVLVVYSSLSSTDPGDIFVTIEEAVCSRVRVSVICLCAEVYICKQLAARTGGTFAVALDSTHLEQLLQAHTIPPPTTNEGEGTGRQVADCIYMGFPKRVFDLHPSFCFSGKHTQMSADGYVCPRCHTRSTDIPTQCCVCSLQLNSSSHIARSHHHLFPVPSFVEYSIVRRQRLTYQDMDSNEIE